jgi:hypothetical protein
MAVVLHGSARTTPRVRAKLQASIGQEQRRTRQSNGGGRDQRKALDRRVEKQRSERTRSGLGRKNMDDTGLLGCLLASAWACVVAAIDAISASSYRAQRRSLQMRSRTT